MNKVEIRYLPAGGSIKFFWIENIRPVSVVAIIAIYKKYI